MLEDVGSNCTSWRSFPYPSTPIHDTLGRLLVNKGSSNRPTMAMVDTFCAYHPAQNLSPRAPFERVVVKVVRNASDGDRFVLAFVLCFTL